MKTEADNFINRYEGLEVKYIPGHNPDLVIYEDEVRACLFRITHACSLPSLSLPSHVRRRRSASI